MKKQTEDKNDIIKERVMRGGSFLCDEAICRGITLQEECDHSRYWLYSYWV